MTNAFFLLFSPKQLVWIAVAITIISSNIKLEAMWVIKAHKTAQIDEKYIRNGGKTLWKLCDCVILQRVLEMHQKKPPKMAILGIFGYVRGRRDLLYAGPKIVIFCLNTRNAWTHVITKNYVAIFTRLKVIRIFHLKNESKKGDNSVPLFSRNTSQPYFDWVELTPIEIC